MRSACCSRYAKSAWRTAACAGVRSRAPLTRQKAAGSGSRAVRVAAQVRQAFKFLLRLWPAAGLSQRLELLSRSATR